MSITDELPPEGPAKSSKMSMKSMYQRNTAVGETVSTLGLRLQAAASQAATVLNEGSMRYCI